MLPIHHRFNITIHQILMIMADASWSVATRQTSASPILHGACACVQIAATAPTLPHSKSLRIFAFGKSSVAGSILGSDRLSRVMPRLPRKLPHGGLAFNVGISITGITRMLFGSRPLAPRRAADTTILPIPRKSQRSGEIKQEKQDLANIHLNRLITSNCYSSLRRR